ncbi:MAG: bifunctional alpha,alpha-trehalose-phosphate synthase (UDP-forming)/trehalose-phosphatase [Myxococcales bacterium]|nr:bifunctional alpha,alpha-trehalose-phosphate synthase (UDP-forming)/trehalose-phosphatase [Myxococcales bacterium]
MTYGASNAAAPSEERREVSRTWLVSNRIPYHVLPDGTLRRNDGGLVTALLPVHRRGKCGWVGQRASQAVLAAAAQLGERGIVEVEVDPAVSAAHYGGASNAGIWPLFHYFQAYTRFNRSDWQAYRQVNDAFARAIAAHAEAGDRVWIHDYHLMLLPRLLRERRPDLAIGYFHHIPFPTSEVLKLHPARDELLNGLLGADLVGFHTIDYARHFTSSASRLLGIDGAADVLHVGDRLVRVGAFPLGIDASELLPQLDTEAHRAAYASLTREFAGRRIVLGVDRLDYTKGILERLRAFEQLLRDHPEHRGHVTLVQLCVPSRTEVEQYDSLRHDVEREVGRINGELGSTSHAPVHYLFQRRALPELLALYRLADVCLVTPLRDGLNLVCKEYVAARADLDGVLILSEFAGAAEEMGEALIVNPFDVHHVSAALHDALTMPELERRTRMTALRQRVLSGGGELWAETFLDTLDEIAVESRLTATRTLDDDECERLAVTFAAGRAVVVLDLDVGVESSIGPDPTLCALITRLRMLTGVTLVLVSRLSRQELEDALGPNGAWVIAERGAELRDDAGHWQTLPGGPSLDPYRSQVLQVLEQRRRLTPGSRIIEREASIHFRTGRRLVELTAPMLLESAHLLNRILSHSPWNCTRTADGLLIRSSQHHSGAALDAVLSSIGRVEAERGVPPIPTSPPVFVVGDRFSEESLLRARGGAFVSIAIGTAAPLATYHLASLEQLVPMVETIFTATLGRKS